MNAGYTIYVELYGGMEILMQSAAYKLTGFSAVIAALGFLLRWLQNMNIIDPETGLAVSGATISTLVVFLIVVFFLVLVGWCLLLRRCDAPLVPEEAFVGKTFLATVFGVVTALALAVSGAIRLIQAGGAMWPVVQRLCGIGSLAAALGVLMMVTGLNQPEKAGTRRVGSAVVVLFGCLWLIASYKDAAADPVLWRYGLDIVAVCVALIAFYYVAGFYFGEPKPLRCILFCFFGGFLCAVCVIDEHSLAESVTMASVALMLFMWGFLLTQNLRQSDRPFKLDEELIK